MSDDYLFNEARLSDWLSERERDAVRAAQSLSADRVLQVPVPDLVDELMEQFRADPPVLRTDDRYTRGAEDVQIDVSRDSGRIISDRSRPFYISGTRIEVHIPFHGDSNLFRFMPSSFTTVLPGGEVREMELIVAHESPADQAAPDRFQQRLDEEVGLIQRYLEWVANDCATFNEKLRGTLERSVTHRREKVLADRNLEEALRIPVARRGDASLVVAMTVPKRRKRITAVSRGTRGMEAFSPEPTISDEDYADILNTMADWRAAVERLPETFAPMGEEALRDSLLVVLNNQFGTGGSEVFSRKGKTDIFIQHDAGAVFIAECKVWNGPKAFARAVDQLLGYLVWRDTKSALVLFVRQKDVTGTAQKAEEVLQEHPRFKRRGEPTKGIPRFVLHHEKDPNREIDVALVVVPLPPQS